jgi:uncharacterized cupredoxin-like copper-binding protein
MMSFRITGLARRVGVLGATAGLVALSAAAILTERDEVEVILQDGAIEAADSTTSGETLFRIRNDGERAHGLAVRTVAEEPREVAALDETVAPGETALLEAMLEPGSYEIYCPVSSHRDQGMSRVLTVVDQTD